MGVQWFAAQKDWKRENVGRPRMGWLCGSNRWKQRSWKLDIFRTDSWWLHYKPFSYHWSLSIPPGNIRQSEVFWCSKGYIKRPMTWNGLMEFGINACWKLSNFFRFLMFSTCSILLASCLNDMILYFLQYLLGNFFGAIWNFTNFVPHEVMTLTEEE